MNFFTLLSEEEIKPIFSFVPDGGTFILVLVCKEFKKILLKEKKVFKISYITSRLKLLEYAINNGYICNNLTLSDVAFYGKLDCLKFLHLAGFKLNTDVFNDAVLSGNLDCLKYLHKNGCPIYKYASWHAALRCVNQPIPDPSPKPIA